MPMFKRSSHTSPDDAVALDSPMVKAKVREAYDKGRIEERRRHRGSPTLTLAVVAIALVGAVTLYYAVRTGSFSGAGAVVDQKIAQASSQAAPAVESAAAKAGAAAEGAGDKLKAQGQAIQQAAPDSSQPAANP